MGWLVLRPVLDGAVYLVIFGLLLRSNRGIENFLGYLVIGVFMFQFTSRCLSSGAMSLIGGRALMKSFAFPRAVLPIATVAREAISYFPVLGAMLALVLLIPPGVHITWRWALLPLVVLLQIVFCLGLALMAARATARVPDLQHLIGLGTRFWLYGSAVFFSYDQFISHPTVLAMMRANPMFQVLDIARDLVLYQTTPTWTPWAVLTAWALGTLVLGFLYFWRAEERYGAL
ncbi:ABC transporter permease [Cellulomonas hominis]